MRIEDLQVELRERTAWEAADLGVRLVRDWAGSVWGAWAAFVLPLHLLFCLLAWVAPGTALLLAWLSLPLAERVVLFVLSRRLFGARPRLGEVARGLWQHGRAGLLADLSLRRLSPSRVFVLPVTMLEGLSGPRARQRRRDLQRSQDLGLWGLGMASAFAELGALAGLFTFVSWLLPGQGLDNLELMLDGLVDAFAVSLAMAMPVLCLAWAVIVPLRTGSAFALYIQRRTALEGWDVELTFRRLASRLSPLAVLLVLLLGAPALAALPSAAPLSAEQEQALREELTEVLAGEDFGGTTTVRQWRPRWELEGPSGPDVEMPVLGELMATLAQVALALVVGLALVGLLYAILGRDRRWRRRAEREEGLGGPVVGALEEDVWALPAEPAERAWALWVEGRHAEALGLLYAAAVHHLVTIRGLELPDSATEGECLRRARRSLPVPTVAYLARLTRAWQKVAYAHRRLPDEEMSGLVRDWPQLNARGQ